MNEQVEHRGRCLCGAVEVTIAPASVSVGACHCSMCRKWAGGPQMMVECGSHQIFIDEKPAYYAFANETTNMRSPRTAWVAVIPGARRATRNPEVVTQPWIPDRPSLREGVRNDDV